MSFVIYTNARTSFSSRTITLRTGNTSPPKTSNTNKQSQSFNTSQITSYYNNITSYDMWSKMRLSRMPTNIQKFLIENNSSIKNLSLTTKYLDTNSSLDDLINIVGNNIIIYKIKSIYLNILNSTKSINFAGFNSDSNNINDIYYCLNLNQNQSYLDQNQTWDLIKDSVYIIIDNNTYINYANYYDYLNDQNLITNSITNSTTNSTYTYCEYIITKTYSPIDIKSIIDRDPIDKVLIGIILGAVFGSCCFCFLMRLLIEKIICIYNNAKLNRVIHLNQVSNV